MPPSRPSPPRSAPTSRPPKRKPGAQPGNTNAVKTGFFARALPAARRIQYEIALGLDPLDLTDAIALLKERIQLLIKAEEDAQQDRLDLLIPALGRLTRMVATHYHLSQSDTNRLTDATRSVLEDIERTLGRPRED